MQACLFGHVEVAQALIDAKADVNIASDVSTATDSQSLLIFV
jgi:ankyrin repeat protein